MRHLASYLAGGLAVALAIEMFGPRLGIGSTAEVLGAGKQSASAISSSGVDRTLKGDRLVGAREARDQRTIAVVEIVGLRNAAVVYRDHDGREIFRTDPVTNATLVAKDVVLPEVTIRDSGASRVDPVPVNAPRVPVPTGSKLPVGCEPPVSPLASPPPNLLGRCISQIEPPKFAALADATR
jgi:hypothetical protein